MKNYKNIIFTLRLLSFENTFSVTGNTDYIKIIGPSDFMKLAGKKRILLEGHPLLIEGMWFPLPTDFAEALYYVWRFSVVSMWEWTNNKRMGLPLLTKNCDLEMRAVEVEFSYNDYRCSYSVKAGDYENGGANFEVRDVTTDEVLIDYYPNDVNFNYFDPFKKRKELKKVFLDVVDRTESYFGLR